MQQESLDTHDRAEQEVTDVVTDVDFMFDMIGSFMTSPIWCVQASAFFHMTRLSLVRVYSCVRARTTATALVAASAASSSSSTHTHAFTTTTTTSSSSSSCAGKMRP